MQRGTRGMVGVTAFILALSLGVWPFFDPIEVFIRDTSNRVEQWIWQP